MYNWLWVIFSSFYSSTHIQQHTSRVLFVLREMNTLLVYVVMLKPFILGVVGRGGKYLHIFFRCCCLRNNEKKKSLFTNKFEWRGVEKFILTFLAIYSSSQAWKQSKETSSIEMRMSSGLRVIFNSRALDEILVELQNFQVQHQRTNNKRQESLKAFHNTQQKKKCFLII